MIKQALTIAAVALTGTLAAPKAEAGHSGLSITYRSGSASCGCPIYTQRHFRGYDCNRRPIFNYTRLALRHGSSCGHRAVQSRRPRGVHPAHAYQRRGSWISAPRITIHSRSRSHGNRGYAASRGSSRGRTCR